MQIQRLQNHNLKKKSTQFWKNIKIISKSKGNDQDDCQPIRICSCLVLSTNLDDTLFILENSWNYILRHSTKATAVFLLFRNNLVLPSSKLLFTYQQLCSDPLFFRQVWNYNEKLRGGWDSQIVRSKKGKEGVNKNMRTNKQYWLEVHINCLNLKWMYMAIFFLTF